MTNIKTSDNDKYRWLKDERYQAVLKATHTIAYEFNPLTKEQVVSPFINEYLSGNYNGRLLSDVMLEDGVIHPDDIEVSLKFREKVASGKENEMILRLKTPAGPFHWFKMCLYPYVDNDLLSFIGTITDVDKEMRHREALRYRTEYDLTTGIFNKSTFYSTTEKWMKKQPNIPRHLIRFDIDRFKIINEMYSLSEGDKVLCYLADLIKNMAAPEETYARMSSDIFCMCIARTKEEAGQLIINIEQELNKYPIDFQFVLSAGIVSIPTYNGEPINVLCDWAAMAQRTVKGNYINRYAFYNSSLSDALNKEHHITKSMKQALEEGQFIIYIQPKYDIRNRSIVGGEALVRWEHPEDGLISPGDFIPLFERNGFILRLDEYVWELSCQTLRRWIDKGHTPLPISVNVSRVHLHDPEFCSKLLTLIEKYDLPANLIELEITESAYTDNPYSLYDIMDKLQNSGFLFSMDDFGSGYSSLNILKDIPVNLVKIDLSFLQKARRGLAVGQDILRGAIKLIHDIDLPVIAEGVETKEQANFLLNAGCIHAQGYYYAKPMPLPDFEELLWGTAT